MNKIAVLDFGGQYAHLIANRVRRLGVYSEIFDPSTPPLQFAGYKGIIFSGGPQSVYAKNAPTCFPSIFKLGIPILGICYGHQLIAHLLGGKVVPGEIKEYGTADLKIKKHEGLFRKISEKQTQVWMSHGDSVSKLPDGFEVFGATADASHAAIGDLNRNIYGVQFHVEVIHTKRGNDMLSNFLDICGCDRDWDMSQFLTRELSLTKDRVGDKKVFFLVSGGVDSTVAFTLLNRALGASKIYGLFVDTGFMRKNEGSEVKKSLEKLGFKNFHVYNAKKEFFSGLRGIANPEQKRKIIGDLFIKIQRKVVKKLKLNPDEWLLGQGTIYPDTIETGGTKFAAKIKTHHNRVPEIQKMLKAGLVIEPLKELYKDEVREVGAKLGLPEKLVWRHPFPGPGLAVRLLCLSKPSRVKNQAGIEKRISKNFAGKKASARILQIRSVGVQGDSRTYRHPLVISGAFNNFENLEKISTALTNRFREINRVCMVCFPHQIKTIEISPAYCTEKRVKTLQEADYIVRSFMEKEGLQRKIWQFPVILAPISFNGKKGETIILRPVESEEAMTANFFKMPFKLLQKLTLKLQKLPGISGVLYDVTHKPPGTIEWE